MKRILPVFLLMTAVAAHAQRSESGQVFFDAVPFASSLSDSTRLDLYLSVPNAAITFDRSGNQFVGRYQARLKIDGGGKSWLDSTFIRTVKAGATITGVKPGVEFYQLSVSVPSGAYVASLELMDLRTNLVVSNKRSVTVADYFHSPFTMSGLLLVAKIREDSTGYVITPMVTEDVSKFPDGYFLFFEAYNNSGRTRFTIHASYKTPDGRKVMSTSFDKTIPAGTSQQWVRMPVSGVARGSYVAELVATPPEDSTQKLASSERMVSIEGSLTKLPMSEDDLTDKISQLRYVATQSEMDYVKDGASLAERQKRYAEFWQKLDPTPGTPLNEAMDDYFQRIQYANDKFRSYAPGWLTDKGRVYIIFGPPDNISTDPFRGEGKSVETWQYYDRGLRAVFVDESGFGDFHLVSSIPIGEKYHYGGS